MPTNVAALRAWRAHARAEVQLLLRACAHARAGFLKALYDPNTTAAKG